jgi:hypothetical protein
MKSILAVVSVLILASGVGWICNHMTPKYEDRAIPCDQLPDWNCSTEPGCEWDKNGGECWINRKSELRIPVIRPED